MKNLTTILSFSTILVGGCSNTPSSQLDYKQEDIKPSGIIEARAYLSDTECPALIYAEKNKQTAGTESALLITAGVVVGKKMIDEAIKLAAKNIKNYGDSLSSPFTTPVFLSPEGEGVSNSKCLIIGYGEFGGESENNTFSNNKLPWSLYSPTKLGEELNGNLGFAMQIKINESDGNIYFTPYNLFYPKRMRPYGVNNHHSITVTLDFKDTKLIMEFGDVKQGTYLTYQALKTHIVFTEKDKIPKNNISISIAEGPDSPLLGSLMAAAGSDETAKQVSSAVQEKVDEKIPIKKTKQ